MAIVELQGGPRPYREALIARLGAGGHQVTNSEGASAGQERGPDVVVVYCDDETAWREAIDRAVDEQVVVVLTELEIGCYARALQAGAAVVHIDTSTEIMASVIESAVSSEALLPMAIASRLAVAWQPTAALADLTPLEARLGEALAAGATIQRIADQLSYSDRTIRRKLQGLYLKLGASNRSEAIAKLARRSQPGV